MRQTILVALLVAFFAAMVVADDSNPPAAGAAAKQKRDAAVKEAGQNYRKALVAADQQYLVDLDAALKQATSDQNIDSAAALQKQKKAALATLKRDQGALEPSQVPADLSFSNFSSTTGLLTNGFGSASVVDNGKLRLLDNRGGETRSVYWGRKVSIASFSCDFSFLISGDKQADGFTFCIQNDSASALRGGGSCVGYFTGDDYSGGIRKSAALTFLISTDNCRGSNLGFYATDSSRHSGGAQSPVGGGLDFHAGHVINVHLTYDGTTLIALLTDATNPDLTYAASYDVDLAGALGADTAYVGFTAATGGLSCNLDIITWTYKPTAIDVPNPGR